MGEGLSIKISLKIKSQHLFMTGSITGSSGTRTAPGWLHVPSMTGNTSLRKLRYYFKLPFS